MYSTIDFSAFTEFCNHHPKQFYNNHLHRKLDTHYMCISPLSPDFAVVV